ncbi:glutamate receptor 1-like [Scylla paramamosain]|uniref:glutamate receptor 1-like n=1 Tax=Scylla paramamosain TaxID=85552 RepID=UPI0030835BC8
MEGRGNETCIRVACVMFMPHIIVSASKTNPVVNGTLLEFFEAVGRTIGRCMQYISEPTNEGGILLPNGTWTGAVGLIQREEADVTMMLIISMERATAFEFSDFLYIEEHTAGYKRPIVGSDISGFIKPFSPWVWIVIGVAVVGVLFSLSLLSVAQRNVHHTRDRRGYDVPSTCLQEKKEKECDMEDTNVGPVRNAVLWTLCALIAQAVHLQPPKGRLKVLTGLWLLLSLTLVTVYRSNLKAMLILPKIDLPFNNVEELSFSGLPLWVSLNSVLHETAMLWSYWTRCLSVTFATPWNGAGLNCLKDGPYYNGHTWKAGIYAVSRGVALDRKRR